MKKDVGSKHDELNVVGDDAHINVNKIRDLDPEMRSGMEPRPYAKCRIVGSGFHP